MKSKLIELTDGSKLEVKVNFYTLYLVKMNGIDKKLDGRDDLTEEENMELAGKMIYGRCSRRDADFGEKHCKKYSDRFCNGWISSWRSKHTIPPNGTGTGRSIF